MTTASTSRAATVEFDHVTKVYGASASKRGTPGAVNDLSLTVPAGKICVLVGPVGLRQDDLAQDGQPADRADVGPHPARRGGRGDAQRDRPPARASATSSSRPACSPTRRSRRTSPPCPGCSAGRRRASTSGRRSCWPSSGSIPAAYAGRYPAQLSGGERQRVGVARALAADPPIMLMDEPFGAVDPIVRERLQNEFLRLQEQLAKTILFVTHDIDEAIKMGDLVAVFRAGGIVEQFGPPSEILAAPASPFVARFVGADRGLKRLSLTRVNDLELAHGSHGQGRRRRGRRAPAGPGGPVRVPAPARRRRAAARAGSARRGSPARARSRRRSWRPPRRSWTGGRRSRTRCRSSSIGTCRPASSSIAGRLPRHRHGRPDRGLHARQRAGDADPGRGANRRPGRRRAGRGRQA